MSEVLDTIERFLRDIDPEQLKLVAVIRHLMDEADTDLTGAVACLDDAHIDQAITALKAVTEAFQKGVRRDPRLLGGKIVDAAGDPFAQGGAVIDTRDGVLLEETDVAMVDNPSDGRRFAAFALAGRINRTPERAEVLYLLSGDAGAAIVSELAGLASRENGEWAQEFRDSYRRRAAELPER